MTEQPEEEKYQWIVWFHPGGRLYTYLNRTVPHMAEVLGRYHAQHGKYPHRVWVIVDNEIQKVVITQKKATA